MTRLLGLVVASIAVTAVSPVAPGFVHEDPPGLAVLDADKVPGGVIIDGYKCAPGTCAGLKLLKPNGKGLKGCTAGATTCSGNCTYCSGTTPLQRCVAAPRNTCIAGGGSLVNCPTAFSNPCFYSLALGLFEPCDCNNTGGTLLSGPCAVSECL
jgi:hypothetical protein